MAKEKNASGENCNLEHGNRRGNNAASGGIYGLAFVGALIYFIQHADTFWIGVLGFFKALVWPAIVIYKVLEFFNL